MLRIKHTIVNVDFDIEFRAKQICRCERDLPSLSTLCVNVLKSDPSKSLELSIPEARRLRDFIDAFIGRAEEAANA